jgi:hypothetical protein
VRQRATMLVRVEKKIERATSSAFSIARSIELELAVEFSSSVVQRGPSRSASLRTLSLSLSAVYVDKA